MKIIDLRSDTVTKPGSGMLQAMITAEVGDDVYGEDPTVRKLEEMIADLAGMEAALFAPTGTQSNLLGIMAHCERGDEYIVGQTAHTYLWEGGGASVLGSVQPQPLEFEKDGTLSLDKIEMAIKPIDDHHVRTKLLCLENTTNGKVLSLEYLKQVKEFCLKRKLPCHLDGARVFNAAVSLNVDLKAISSNFGSISICLSKGLGAPIGSVLCGTTEVIRKARRWRKVLGGGMRQVGIMAAAGIYALKHNVARLKEDHENAAHLATALADIDELEIVPESLHTNMLFIKTARDYSLLQSHLQEKGIRFPSQPERDHTIRLVTHLDVADTDVQRIVQEIKAFYKAR